MFSEYGKEFIKTCKVSPDAFVQLALQIAYYKDSDGKFVLTYESSMTRLFLHGRTETVRPVSIESEAFVRAFFNPNISVRYFVGLFWWREPSSLRCFSAYAYGLLWQNYFCFDASFPSTFSCRLAQNAEKIKLLQVAADKHQMSYRDAMTGKGVDRHLFALYVLAKGTNVTSPFLNKALSIPYTMSTSQQPQNQTGLVDVRKHPELVQEELFFLVDITPFSLVRVSAFVRRWLWPGERRGLRHLVHGRERQRPLIPRLEQEEQPKDRLGAHGTQHRQRPPRDEGPLCKVSAA